MKGFLTLRQSGLNKLLHLEVMETFINHYVGEETKDALYMRLWARCLSMISGKKMGFFLC